MEENKQALQELYRNLEHTTFGHVYMAWYGQLRALGYQHNAAINMTLDHFEITKKDWWQSRQGFHPTIEEIEAEDDYRTRYDGRRQDMMEHRHEG